MKLQDIKQANELTEKETTVLDHLYEALASYFGELYSDVDCIDISKAISMPIPTVKGVVGSLVKKGILGTYDTGTGFEVVCFIDQEEME